MKRFITLFVIIAISATSLFAQKADPDGTYMFAQRDGQDLFLDFYKPSAAGIEKASGKEMPTIIFIFGGSFSHGSRDADSHRRWFQMMIDEGYSVASIDYRLGMKDVRNAGVNMQFIKNLQHAIDIAVEDLYAATNFLIDNHEELGINPEMLVPAGSSAGAITALQAEWHISNADKQASVLPEGFNYAGVMAFSGAVLSMNGKVKFGKSACPLGLFHGTVDKMVPYNKISLAGIHFDGSSYLEKSLKKNRRTYHIYRYADHGHEVSISMPWMMREILEFLDEEVIRKVGSSSDTTVDDSPMPTPDWAKADFKTLY